MTQFGWILDVFEDFSILAEKQRLKPRKSNSLMNFASLGTQLDPQVARLVEWSESWVKNPMWIMHRDYLKSNGCSTSRYDRHKARTANISGGLRGLSCLCGCFACWLFGHPKTTKQLKQFLLLTFSAVLCGLCFVHIELYNRVLFKLEFEEWEK